MPPGKRLSDFTVPRIQRLPEVLVSQIAAGEVIESPVGVVKELAENSIDADATQIEIYCHDAGFAAVQVRDNGSGILKEDLPLAIEPFATSKISAFDDLFRVYSMGFRGEALGSIRSVARLTIESRATGAEGAWKIFAAGEQVSAVEPSALPVGTRVLVEDLFFNTPVRREFVKSQRQIRRQILDLVADLSLAHPKINFSVSFDGKEAFRAAAKDRLTARIDAVYGTAFSDNLLPVYYKEQNYTVEGYISNYSFYRTGATDIRFFVNQRPVQFKRLVGLLRHAYGELMPPGRFPVALLFFHLPAEELDVNVHPQKKEIRFRDEARVIYFLQAALRETIERRGPFRLADLSSRKKPTLAISGGEETGFDFLPRLNFSAPPEETQTASGEELPEEETSPPIQQPSTPHFAPQAAHARLFDTFVLASSEEGVYLIDQHTAHERINYEAFLRKLKQQENVAQTLAIPLSIVLSPGDRVLFEENSGLLRSLGFVLEDLGPAGWALTAVPFYVKSGDEERALRTAIRVIEEEGGIDNVRLFEQMAKNLSCRHAIKKGDSDSVANLSELIDALSRCETPGRCPHGRPTMVFLGRSEIFSLFKRRPE